MRRLDGARVRSDYERAHRRAERMIATDSRQSSFECVNDWIQLAPALLDRDAYGVAFDESHG
jgi:hypothetical protein